MVFCAAFALLAAVSDAGATDLRVSDITVQTEQRPGATRRRVEATVSWRNGWRTARNHDAAWVFLKLKTAAGGWRHLRMAAEGHHISAIAGLEGRLVVSEDRVGLFCVPASNHRGDVAWKLSLALDPASDAPGDVHAFGIEMVHIPSGAFTLGDPDPVALDYAAVYRSDAAGGPNGLFQVTSEAAIDIGPRAGALYYRTKQPEYEGDRLGPLPAPFPKGFGAFYAMKYELTQGEYAAFLNTLPGQATYFRAIHGGREYAASRGTVRLQASEYVAAVPDRPANFVSWNDGLAFADWAGLRPMTELEFTKAARGPSAPIAHEFPWGTATADRLRRVMRLDDDLERSGEADEMHLSDQTRDVLGGSFYWVMDLAGSVWERVITFGHPRGRAFRGSHGDGTVSGYGDATNVDWPLGDQDAGGYGYRGGGYYERGMTVRDFNPYSPVAYRRYGSWGGGPRSIAYGFRAVRTAP